MKVAKIQNCLLIMYLGKVSIKFQTFLIKEWRHTKEKLKNNIENP